jgi:hypothetical protein
MDVPGCVRIGPAHLAGIKPGDIQEDVDGKSILPPATPYFGIGQNHTIPATAVIASSLICAATLAAA